MKKSLSSRIAALAVVVSLILGIVIGMNVASTIQENRMKVHAYEQENAGTDVVSYFEGIENALFPMHQGVKISQTAFEQYSHSKFDPYRNRYFESNAMDIYSDIDKYMYAPFTGRVVDFNSSCNCFAFQSENKVRYANGDYDYMTVYFLHSAQYNQIQHYLQSGELIPQGSRMVAQGGSDGKNNNAYGEHLDVQVRKGKNPGIDSDVKLNGNTFAYDAFFKGNETTFEDYYSRTRISPGEYPQYAGEWKKDKYDGAWASSQEDVFLPIDSFSRSILKVSCNSDIAFDQEYNLSDFLFGRVLASEIERIATIGNVVDNYISLDYAGLSDFEKKVYDACITEWVDSIPDNTPSESETEDKTLLISFVPGENAFCDELEREITWGTCTYPFPTPYKLGDTFIAWLDDNDEEVTCNSFITNNITLHAKWMNDSIPLITAPPVTTPPEEETEIVSVEAEVKQAPNVISEESVAVNIENNSPPTDDHSEYNTYYPFTDFVSSERTITISSSTDNYNWVPGYDIGWKLEGDVFTITGSGPMPDYPNPSYAPWVSVGQDVKTVIIQEGVTRVGTQAFTYFKNMTEAYLPNSILAIGRYAFQTTKIQSISLPPNLKSIEQGAFSSCKQLKSITIPDSVTSIDTYVFSRCDSLSSVVLSNNITSIGDGTFEQCYNLRSLNIPTGVQSIGAYAFMECNMETIYIPESLRSVGYGGFYNASIQQIHYGGTESDWNNIDIYNVRNEILSTAAKFFNS